MVNTIDKPGNESPPTERPLRVLGLPAVMDRTNLSKSHIYAEMRAGRFPKSVTLSTNKVGWFEHEIDAWLRDRMRERDNAAVAV
ncbi:MAG TPA: AlpA family phage regulatory protein [Gemmatimonadaceae bacterium]|jgi:prophage regulatory protein